MIKRILLFIFAAMFALSLTACGQSEDGAAVGTQKVDGWSVSVRRCEIAEDLSTTQSAVQYGGESVSYDVSEKPQEGNVFVLIEMVIEKEGTGASKFLWDNAYVEDAQGTRYSRHTNDTFLRSFNLLRIKSTDLVLGKNEGFVCYELPSDAAKGDLYFVYETDDESVKMQIQ